MPYQIGPRLRKYREARGLTQKEFAARIGVTNSRVCNWEAGVNRPDVDLLAVICKVLCVSPSELLDVRLDPNDLTERECRLIKAYRQKTTLQQAVNILLDIE